MLTSNFTHNRLGIEPEFFKVSLVEKFVRNSFGQKVLLFPRFSNSAYITGCHQHSTENCKRYKTRCQMSYKTYKIRIRAKEYTNYCLTLLLIYSCMPNRIWILALEFKFQIRFGTCIVSGTVGGR